MIIRQLLKLVQRAGEIFIKSMCAHVVEGAVIMSDTETHILNNLSMIKETYAKLLAFKFDVVSNNDEDMTMTGKYLYTIFGYNYYPYITEVMKRTDKSNLPKILATERYKINKPTKIGLFTEYDEVTENDRKMLKKLNYNKISICADADEN